MNSKKGKLNFLAVIALTVCAHSVYAEALLDTEIVASQESGQSVSLLIKVTDRAPLLDSIAGNIATWLQPPGQCTAKATDDIRRSSPCYVVHLWENDSLIPIVKETILDNIGWNGWVLLSYQSEKLNVSRRVRLEIGNNGYYTDYSGRIHNLRESHQSNFSPMSPYRFLYSQADRALNALYQERIQKYRSQRQFAEADQFRSEERNWVKSKEEDCGSAMDEEGFRCLWYRTQWRIKELSPQPDSSD